MKKIAILITALITSIFCLLAIGGYAQSQYTISGHIKDGSTGETLIGATVYVNELSKGTVTNMYGFYSITIPQGLYSIKYSYVGFDDTVKNIQLDQDLQLTLELSSDQLLETVVVTGNAIDENISNVEMSTVKLDIQSIRKMPAFAGEVDILKSIQLLPGVSTVGEGAAGFNVRGGTVGQNLVLLDEAPVYQSSHMMGFFSVFNPDAVQDVKLYKGGIPAKYGGRLSSVLDIRMKEGNNKSYTINGGLGTVFSRLSVEGPIKKGKSSFILAGRRSYADVFAKVFTNKIEKGTGLYFYDLTAKTNFTLNKNNRIYFSGYLGRDVFNLDKSQGFNWGNRTGTIRWNHLYGNKLFSNVSLFYSSYDYGFSFGTDGLDKFDWRSKINTFNFKPEFTWFANLNNELTFGCEAIMYDLTPGEVVSINNGVTSNINLDSRKALEASAYMGNDQHLTKNLSVQYGLRYSHFANLGGKSYYYADTIPGIKKRLLRIEEKKAWEAVANYQNLEPRASVKYQLSSSSSIKGSYNRMSQYLHQVSNTTASTPIDIWQPSNNNIKPQVGNQLALGYFKNIHNNSWETSVEAYYKWNKNQIDYVEGAELFINEFLDGQLLSGLGRSYGLELYARKNSGRITGWVSYTIGKTELKVDGINFGNDITDRKGEWYPTRFDQRHNLKIASFYKVNEKISLSANFSYVSGTPTTFPTDRIHVGGYVIPYIKGSSRNNVRIPDYHRLDVAITFNNIWRGKKERRGEDNLVISIYNVYARQNAFSVYFSQGTERQDSQVVTQAKQLSMIGTIVPSVTYNFKF